MALGLFVFVLVVIKLDSSKMAVKMCFEGKKEREKYLPPLA